MATTLMSDENQTKPRFGCLLVIKEVDRKNSKRHFECLCDCGKTTVASDSNLKAGLTRSCGHLRGRPRKVRPPKIKKPHVGAERWLYNKYQASARSRSKDFSISIEEFVAIIRSDCHYCGLPPAGRFIHKTRKYDLTYNGIDRIDNEVGYVSSNCVPCCKFCNRLKSIFKAEEFQNWLSRLKAK